MTDSATVIQGAIDLGETLPPGTLSFAAPLTVPAGRSLVGSGPNQTTLVYTGPPADGGCVVLPSQSFGFSLCGFSLHDATKRKQGCGIRAGAENTGQSGTQAGMARIDDVWVDGFRYGARFGDKALNSSCSEVTLTNFKASTCDVGVRIETQNSLDYTFIQLGLTASRIGIETDGASCIHVLGGSCSDVTEAVWSNAGAGTFSMKGLRTEGCGYLFVQGNTSACAAMTVDGCETNDNRRTDGVDVLARGGSDIQVRGGTYAGSFAYEGAGGEPPWGYGGICLDAVKCYRPYILSTSTRNKGRWSIRNCRLLNSAGQVVRVLGDANGQWLNALRVPAQ